MEHYTADAEVENRDLTHEKIDQAMDYLADYAPALGTTPRGHTVARITVPADSIGQAARTAALLVEHALASSVIRLDVMLESEADLREGDLPVPELVGTTEAAQMLGVSEQRVRQMVVEGKLAGHRIGERSLALVRAAVAAKASRA